MLQFDSDTPVMYFVQAFIIYIFDKGRDTRTPLVLSEDAVEILSFKYVWMLDAGLLHVTDHQCVPRDENDL